MSDDELPDLASLILRPTTKQPKTLNIEPSTLRRSPRKQKAGTTIRAAKNLLDAPELFASSQQRISPRKQASPKSVAAKPARVRGSKPTLHDVPDLAPRTGRAALKNVARSLKPVQRLEEDDSLVNLLKSPRKLALEDDDEEDRFSCDSDKENVAVAPSRPGKKNLKPTSTMSQITQAARKQNATGPSSRASRATRGAQARNPYILKEARCQDFDESSGSSGEDEDTDLSGFIVEDGAELSVYGSGDESVSEEEDDIPQRRGMTQKAKKLEASPRRNLIRGRKKQISDDEAESDDQGLAKVLDGMHLGDATLEKQRNADRRQTIEVIDLTSSPVQQEHGGNTDTPSDQDAEESSQDEGSNPILKWNNTLQLKPSLQSNTSFLPSKTGPMPSSPRRQRPTDDKKTRPQTPPATPPRSPSKTKLASPSKLLSPSKRGDNAPRSPHRQSMDAFWDHNVVNEWHDTFSPKKAPTLSPRKNPLARFNLFADDFGGSSDIDSSLPTSSINDSQDPFDDSLDSLPSPSESPAKSRSPSKVSAIRAEQQRIREEKKARTAAKKKFDAEKEGMAMDLLIALDNHVTDSKISDMAASTGGIRVIWSKTLRSTAGRANWKRTVTKPSGSPIKGNPDSQSVERQPGVIVQHFANIELAEKIIDRPERLVNTLAHEFCHLANFMVSGVRDQPHGESFKRWGKQVTSWLKSSSALKAAGYREEWKLATVTTKHDYIVETKYLWACVGRPAHMQKQSLAMKMLEIENEDQESCGAEYGRHSKSIDTEKQRCGRCKGFLVQVRPTPRAAPASPRKSPVKKGGLRTLKEESSSGVEGLEKMMEVVELSD